jgi:hypothetical protein
MSTIIHILDILMYISISYVIALAAIVGYIEHKESKR